MCLNEFQSPVYHFEIVTHTLQELVYVELYWNILFDTCYICLKLVLITEVISSTFHTFVFVQNIVLLENLLVN
jgi:hypothetical protein